MPRVLSFLCWDSQQAGRMGGVVCLRPAPIF
jgi:hypothetical protein